MARSRPFDLESTNQEWIRIRKDKQRKWCRYPLALALVAATAAEAHWQRIHGV
jgi:hypothetical protein